MRADRVVQRRRWRSDCPPIFNQRQRELYALHYGLPKPKPRVTYREWLARRVGA